MVQYAAQSEGQTLSTPEVLGFFDVATHFSQFVVVWWNCASYTNLYFRLLGELEQCGKSVAITCKSSLHIKLEWEVDREQRNNRNNEQKQGHKAAATVWGII